eukprot:s638_g15.t3
MLAIDRTLQSSQQAFLLKRFAADRPELLCQVVGELELIRPRTVMEQEILEKVLDASWCVFKQQVIQSMHAVSARRLDSKDSVSDCGTGANLSHIWSRGVSPDMYIIDHNSVTPSDFHEDLREDFREEQMLRRITSQSQGSAAHVADRELAPYLHSRLADAGKEHARAIRRRLRLRLGVISASKCVTGKSLHEAVSALGLTRYSLQEVSTLVDHLACFINLRFEKEKKDKLTAVIEDDNVGRAVWEWPPLKETHTSASSWMELDHPKRPPGSLVPAQALMQILLAEDGEVHRRIFGQSLPTFRAMREVLLAGDTNRLVAELTFVRLNDLAAPPDPTPPLLFVEGMITWVIIANAVMTLGRMGVQMDPAYSDWDGFFWCELVFTSLLLLEVAIRYMILGWRQFFCGQQVFWNLFDLFLLGCALTDVTREAISEGAQALNGSSLLRLCRLVRLVRIIKAFRLKFMGELRLMVKGLIAGLRTLSLAFTLLFVVISGFATTTIGTSKQTAALGLEPYFRTLPDSMFTAFRCFTGECVNDSGQPLHSLLAAEFGVPFVAGYVASYMLVSMGIFNVILAVYVDITMKAAKENEALTAEQHSRESIRIARVTRELLKKFAAAFRMFQDFDDSTHPCFQRLDTSMFTDDQIQEARLDLVPGSTGWVVFSIAQSFSNILLGLLVSKVHSCKVLEKPVPHHELPEIISPATEENIAITKELFLLVIQDRSVQALMDDLELPRDRANLFEIIDADGSGTLQVVELVQGLLKIRGEVSKSDTVASYLATKSLQETVHFFKEDFSRQFAELRSELQQRNQYLDRQVTAVRSISQISGTFNSRSPDFSNKVNSEPTSLLPKGTSSACLGPLDVPVGEAEPTEHGGHPTIEQLKPTVKPEVPEDVDITPPQPLQANPEQMDARSPLQKARLSCWDREVIGCFNHASTKMLSEVCCSDLGCKTCRRLGLCSPRWQLEAGCIKREGRSIERHRFAQEFLV